VDALRPRDRQLTVRTALVDGHIEVAVADRGKGIAPADLERVFEPFVTTKPHGMGLGLAVCRTIVTAHAGRIWAARNPDAGTTFRFTVPVALTKAAAA
jgi:two-component system sensor kinase FixL